MFIRSSVLEWVSLFLNAISFKACYVCSIMGANTRAETTKYVLYTNMHCGTVSLPFIVMQTGRHTEKIDGIVLETEIARSDFPFIRLSDAYTKLVIDHHHKEWIWIPVQLHPTL